MKKLISFVLIVAVVVGVGLFFINRSRVDLFKLKNNNFKNTTMQITSPAFQNEGDIPAKYTCKGEGINPPLQFSSVPQGTVSLVLVVDDPDAPSGTWTHWTLWNIDPSVSEIAENSIPKGAVEGTTSAGTKGYHGPCPPSGTHRYFFKLYALDTKLQLDSNAKVEDLSNTIQDHILAQAELMERFGN